MRITELQKGTKIFFDVTMGRQELEFPSEVVKVYDTYILAKPVVFKGKIVGLGGAGVSVGVTYLRKDKSPIMWKGVACTLVKMKGQVLCRVIPSGAGFEANRRQAYRLFIGLEGVARVGTNKKALDVILKDVSDTGFAFVYESDLEDIENKPVRLVFNDFDRNYSLTGYVVRKVKAEEGKFVYGCKLNTRNQLLNHYINIKQRQMLANNKNNENYRDRLSKVAQELKQDEYIIQQFDSELDKKDINAIDKSERREIFKNK